MGSDQFPIRLVWRTDVHCADQTPSSRTDDWVETVMDKLVQVGQIAKEVGADAVLDGGDFFNPKAPVRTSHRLMQHIVRVHQLHYDCPVLGNVGNHDVRHSQLSNLPESPLGTLFETEVFERCYTVRHHDTGEVEQYYPASFGGAGGPVVQVEGIPYHGPKYDMRYFKGIKKNERSDFLVVMAHVLASPHGGSMFAGEDIIKYQDLLELNPDVDAWCFLPGTKVLDWNGRLTPIEEVRESLALMGRHGEPVVVEEVHPVRQVDEEVITLDVEGVPSGLMPGVTREHPFWVAADLRCSLPSRKTRRCHPDKARTSYPCSDCTKAPEVKAGWVAASDIKKGDYVAIPVPPSSPDVGISNPQRARLLGLYLAEGHLSLNRKKDPIAGVAWSFHEDEMGLLDQVEKGVKNQFGLKTFRYPTTGRCTQIRAHGSRISEWFHEHGGRYSHAKKMSSEVWSWSDQDKMEILVGWLLGDGHARNPDPTDRVRTEVMGGTVSPQLASQLYLLALSLGLRPSYHIRPGRTDVEICGMVCDTREFHVLSFYGDDGEKLAKKMGVVFNSRTKTRVSGFFHDGMYFARVQEVGRKHYQGPVYNMRTSTEEYVAGMLVTHNCFGHWHKNQGAVEIAPGKWVVNIGSLTRGSLSEDNVDRIPQVAVLTFTDKIEIETRNLKVKPAEEVFDLAKRDREEARTMTIDAFVQQVQDSLINTADKKDLVEVVRGMEEVPAKVRDKTLEYMSKAER